MNSKKFTIFSIMILFAISALIMLRQLTSNGFFSCHGEDTFAYVSWAWQFVEALKEGIIYPRWLPINFWNYGSPTFILLPPFAFYLVAFFNIFTGSVITAMNITKFVALFFSGVGMFYLVKEFYSEKVALLAGSFYIVFPYNIFQFFLVGTFASTVSFMWFAPIILFTYRFMNDHHYKNIIYAGLCYGGLILTHLINAYMFTFVIIAFMIFMSIIKRRPKDITVVLLIIAIGLLISAVYTLPVIFEKQFINLQEFIGERGKRGFLFDYRNFFILPDMTGKFSSAHLWNAFYKIFVFYFFLFCVLITLSFYQMIKIKNAKLMKNTNYINKFFIGTASCTLFLLFGISTFVWEIVPLFRYIQFAHRWLNITTFAVVFLSAIIFFDQDSHYKAKIKRSFIIVLLFLISFLLDFRYIVSANVINEKDLLPVKAANWYREHLPIWVDIEEIDKTKDIKQTAIIQKGEGSVEVIVWKSAERIITVTAQTHLILRIRTFYFPGWKAYLDSEQTAIKIKQGTGAMLIDIPEGKHTLVLKFEDTAVRYYAKLLSLLSLVSIVILVLISKKIKKK